MIIALFGATGQSGKPFLGKALDRFKIKALVRKPDVVTEQHIHLDLIKGDVLNVDDVAKTISGSDVVVSLLGHGKGSPADLQTRAFTNIIEAMKQSGVSRIIMLTGGGVRDEEHDQPGFIDKMIVWVMKNITGSRTRNVLVDGRKSAQILRESNLEWTIVRGPVLTNKPGTGHVEVGHVGTVPGIKLSREDLVDFILKEIECGNYVHQMPFLTNG